MREAEAAVCESCIYFKADNNDPNLLFKICDLHSDQVVKKTLQNAERPEGIDEVALSICDPTKTLCGRYAPNFANMWFAKIYNKHKKKKEEKAARKHQHSEA